MSKWPFAIFYNLTTISGVRAYEEVLGEDGTVATLELAGLTMHSEMEERALAHAKLKGWDGCRVATGDVSDPLFITSVLPVERELDVHLARFAQKMKRNKKRW